MGNRLMGAVDTIWLNMDRPDNLMIIDCLMFFEGPVDWSRVRAVVERRLVDCYPVFSQRPVQPRAHFGAPHWEDDPDFDLDRHIVHATLTGPDGRRQAGGAWSAGDVELRKYIEQLMHVPFDRRHPLWEMHFIDGHRDGSAAYTRIHHALADGIALNQVLLSLTDESPEDDLAEVDEEVPKTSAGLLGEAVRIAGGTASAVFGIASGATHMLLDLPRLLDPQVYGDAFTQAERTGAIVNKLLLRPRARTPFSGRPALVKRAIWSEAFPLSNIKHVGRRTGTTVNDVLMGAVAGALATYMKDHGSEPEDVPTMVPVNVRDLDKPLPKELGNQFALVLFKYPTSLGTPLERIVETHRRMEVIKHSPEVLLTFGLIKVIGRTGPELERFFVDFFAGKAVGVTTNVPGPTSQRYMAGAKITGALSWVPGSGDQTVGVSIYTYMGSVRVGFKTDAACVPDPERLLHAFEEEIAGLLRLSQAV